jgi:TatD DNase family protein
MQLFDSHCHLDLHDFDADRGDVLAAARAVGVREILIPAVKQATWSSLLAFCQTDNRLYPALGLHPVFLRDHDRDDIRLLDDALAATRPAAVGEIGLDYQLRDLDRTLQRHLLDRQLDLAAAHGLPVVLHVRKAHDDMLQHLRQHHLHGGICHAFNGSLEQAVRYRDLGFRLGFGGMLTFERSSHLRRLAAQLPLDSIVLETDAPDMTVASHRFERNSPAYLPEVLQTLAALRNETATEIAAATTANARAALALSDAASDCPDSAA